VGCPQQEGRAESQRSRVSSLLPAASSDAVRRRTEAPCVVQQCRPLQLQPHDGHHHPLSVGIRPPRVRPPSGQQHGARGRFSRGGGQKTPGSFHHGAPPGGPLAGCHPLCPVLQAAKGINGTVIVEWDIVAFNGVIHVLAEPLRVPPPSVQLGQASVPGPRPGGPAPRCPPARAVAPLCRGAP